MLAAADVSVTIASRHAVVVVQDTRFDAGVQLGTEIAVGIEAHRPLGDRARGGVGTAIALGTTLQSAGLGGYVYRGLATRSASIYGWVTLPGGTGAIGGVNLALGSYDLTTLLFFFPEVSVGPMFTTRLSETLSVYWAVPVTYQFRADLAYALSIGIYGRLSVDFRSPRSYS